MPLTPRQSSSHSIDQRPWQQAIAAELERVISATATGAVPNSGNKRSRHQATTSNKRTATALPTAKTPGRDEPLSESTLNVSDTDLPAGQSS
jgi:hypothetical protein